MLNRIVFYIMITLIIIFCLVKFGVNNTLTTIVIVGLLLLYGAWAEKKRKSQILKLLSSGINEIDSMSGLDFELFLQTFFQEKGFNVLRTPASGDYGADLIISNNKISTAIQAKRYSVNVGIKAIQEVVGAMAHYNCQFGMVITNSHYTEPAKKLALSNKIVLWEREDLIKELLSVQTQKGNSEKVI